MANIDVLSCYHQKTSRRTLLTAALATFALPQLVRADDRITVTTTVGMIADIVRNIGGDAVEVIQLMGPGVDPHVYKPTAGDVARLDRAEIIYYGGLQLEGRMSDTFEKIDRGGKPAIPVTERIPEESLLILPGSSGHHDPHVWFDVTLWQLASDVVRDHLVERHPEHTDLFLTNAAAYRTSLGDLHAYVQQQAATVPESQRVLITAHDAFGYFGRQYGFEVRGVQGISTATEAGTRDIQDLVDFIVAREIPAMFVESSVPPTTIDAVKEATRSRGWNVIVGGQLYSDAMGSSDTPQGTYIGMVTWNIDIIATALRGEAEDHS